MTTLTPSASPRERRIARRLEARGEGGLADALLGLRGVILGDQYRMESLYAVGGEGAVYTTRDLTDRNAEPSVAKVALHPMHRPFQLEANAIRAKRYSLRVEAHYLERNRSPFLPASLGTYEFRNPLLDAARGDAFGELEPALVMEKLPGHDLDVWLAHMHHKKMPQHIMRRTLDRVAVVLLQALVDLWDRGLNYADLRPANLRMMGRPERRVRLLDAGSLVAIQDRSGRFPHVPAYLAPENFQAFLRGEPLIPSARLQAIMAGRTLYEAATGRVPMPGQQVDLDLLVDSNVSPPVADCIDALCRGDFATVQQALKYLSKHARRRVLGGNDPRRMYQAVQGGEVPSPKSPHTQTVTAQLGNGTKAPKPLEVVAKPGPGDAVTAPDGEPVPIVEPLPEETSGPDAQKKRRGLFGRIAAWFRGS
jgi:hypothetical protein